VVDRVGRLPSVRQGATILVVEDDDALRFLLVRVLRDAGYSVLEARNGVEALLAPASQPVDLLVADVVMPQVGGVALADALRRERPDLRVLYISGWDDRLPNTSDEPTLTKPFSLDAFELAVKRALASST
jgi:two-component system cell cycle sensor histidine kinase/response regulator CckA